MYWSTVTAINDNIAVDPTHVLIGTIIIHLSDSASLPNSPSCFLLLLETSLHYVMDGVETSYNSWDPIASTNRVTNIIKGKRPQSSPFIIDMGINLYRLVCKILNKECFVLHQSL
ncbi:hypothetical protein BDEG_22639 [Batrachochytrium dendrobatidis JEL423]|uniref:Uncharacterized protein n=1 Tax=Batrachochytrium dendrobatidis (strain JEL423) TaxID=403673 RepID=A0A177WGB6_BATDL|nr:hypothetical protein BDEG_22639 [Batrachochytrium dendrobatidis JEL423]